MDGLDFYYHFKPLISATGNYYFCILFKLINIYCMHFISDFSMVIIIYHFFLLRTHRWSITSWFIILFLSNSYYASFITISNGSEKNCDQRNNESVSCFVAKIIWNQRPITGVGVSCSAPFMSSLLKMKNKIKLRCNVVLYIGVTHSENTGAVTYCSDRCFDGAKANAPSVFSWGCIGNATTDFSYVRMPEDVRV